MATKELPLVRLICQSYYFVQLQEGCAYVQLTDVESSKSKAWIVPRSMSRAKKPKSDCEHWSIVEGLKQLKSPCRLEIISDAQKFVTAYNQGSFEKWSKNGFRKPVNQTEVYKSIFQHLSKHEVVSISTLQASKRSNKAQEVMKDKVREIQDKDQNAYFYVATQAQPYFIVN